MHIAIIITAILALAMSVLSPAHAQQRTPCDDRAKVIAKLVFKYGEAPLWEGVTAGGRTTMELWGAPDGGWTILEIRPGVGDKPDQACPRSVGSGWTTIIWPPAWEM